MMTDETAYLLTDLDAIDAPPALSNGRARKAGLSPALLKLIDRPRDQRYRDTLLEEAEELQCKASRRREEAYDFDRMAGLLLAEHSRFDR